jgi:hypothetical protein
LIAGARSEMIPAVGRALAPFALLLASCVSTPNNDPDGGLSVDASIVSDLANPDDASCVASCTHPPDCPGQFCCLDYSANQYGSATAHCADDCAYVFGVDTGQRLVCDTDNDCFPGGVDLHAASFCCPFNITGFCGSACEMEKCPP